MKLPKCLNSSWYVWTNPDLFDWRPQFSIMILTTKLATLPAVVWRTLSLAYLILEFTVDNMINVISKDYKKYNTVTA